MDFYRPSNLSLKCETVHRTTAVTKPVMLVHFSYDMAACLQVPSLIDRVDALDLALFGEKTSGKIIARVANLEEQYDLTSNATKSLVQCIAALESV